jgi:hypothetical protein
MDKPYANSGTSLFQRMPYEGKQMPTEQIVIFVAVTVLGLIWAARRDLKNRKKEKAMKEANESAD